jgi:hypothetical protein
MLRDARASKRGVDDADHHPADDLDRGGDRADRVGDAGTGAPVLREA